MKTIILWCLVLLIFVCMMFVLQRKIFGTITIIREAFINKKHDIYCLMVTGKNDKRIDYAKVSVINFLKQTYDKKHLIIINESNRSCLDKEYDNILELFVPNTLTLGAKRNMALKLVPSHCIWTTWDDDDWRSNKYLDMLYERLMRFPNKKMLMYCNRLEHNMNTNFTWKVSIPSGTYIFFGFQNNKIEYADMNTKEDSIVKKYIYEHPQDIVLFQNNDPKMYVRFVHKSNTSVFINPMKTTVRNTNRITDPVHEFPATQKEKDYVNRIKKMYE